MSTDDTTGAGAGADDEWLTAIRIKEAEAAERTAQQAADPRALRDRHRPTAPAPEGEPSAPEAPPTLGRRPPAPKARRGQLAIGGVPRVDLLPPDLRAQREWRRARQRALLLILGAVLLLLAGVGAVVWWAGLQTEARAQAQRLTEELTAQQAQFAEVNGVLLEIRTTEAALGEIGTTEIRWDDVLSDLESTLPQGARISILTIEAGAPGAPLAEATDLLQTERAATARLTALVEEAPDVSRWVQAVQKLDGVTFVAPRLTQALTEQPGYTVEITFDLSEERLRSAAEGDAE